MDAERTVVLARIKSSFTEVLDALTKLVLDDNAPIAVREKAAKYLFELAGINAKKHDA